MADYGKWTPQVGWVSQAKQAVWNPSVKGWVGADGAILTKDGVSHLANLPPQQQGPAMESAQKMQAMFGVRTPGGNPSPGMTQGLPPLPVGGAPPMLSPPHTPQQAPFVAHPGKPPPAAGMEVIPPPEILAQAAQAKMQPLPQQGMAAPPPAPSSPLPQSFAAMRPQ